MTGLHRLNCLNCLGDHHAQCGQGGQTELPKWTKCSRRPKVIRMARELGMARTMRKDLPTTTRHLPPSLEITIVVLCWIQSCSRRGKCRLQSCQNIAIREPHRPPHGCHRISGDGGNALFEPTPCQVPETYATSFPQMVGMQ